MWISESMYCSVFIHVGDVVDLGSISKSSEAPLWDDQAKGVQANAEQLFLTWRTVSFFSQLLWIMARPGAVQLSISETLSWMSRCVRFTGSCSDSWLWSSSPPTSELGCYGMDLITEIVSR